MLEIVREIFPPVGGAVPEISRDAPDASPRPIPALGRHQNGHRGTQDGTQQHSC